jgi:hypothetical protein
LGNKLVARKQRGIQTKGFVGRLLRDHGDGKRDTLSSTTLAMRITCKDVEYCSKHVITLSSLSSSNVGLQRWSKRHLKNVGFVGQTRHL